MYVGTATTVRSISGFVLLFFFQAEDGIRDLVRSRGLGDVYKRQAVDMLNAIPGVSCATPGGALYVFPRLDPNVHEILSLIHI